MKLGLDAVPAQRVLKNARAQEKDLSMASSLGRAAARKRAGHPLVYEATCAMYDTPPHRPRRTGAGHAARAAHFRGLPNLTPFLRPGTDTFPSVPSWASTCWGVH